MSFGYKSKIIDAIVRCLPKAVVKKIHKNFLHNYRFTNIESYSQEGEDLVLNRFLGSKERGFYVDVGAHHPKRFSNTYMFYARGWRGINIDAMPGSMESFQRNRPRDINLEQAISNKKQKLQFYLFNEPALNTFSYERSLEIARESESYSVVETIQLDTATLTEILDEYLPDGTHIDFLSIDVEGHDYEVVSSLDFSRYKPTYILIEYLDIDIETILNSDIVTILQKNSYKLICKTYLTLIFRSEE